MEMATLITIKNNTDVHYQSSTIENIPKQQKNNQDRLRFLSVTITPNLKKR